MKAGSKFIALFILIGLCCLLFCSCCVEKRLYRKGYHFAWNHKKASDKKAVEIVKFEMPAEKNGLIASNEEKPEIVEIKKAQLLVLNSDTCGDKLLLQNADELVVKILEIDDNYIKYKRCDNLNGPTYSMAKNKVALITYVNGTKEVIQNQAPNYRIEQTQKPLLLKDGPPKTNVLGLLSLLGHIVFSIGGQAIIYGTGAGSSIALLLLLWIATIIMAYTSLFQFKNEPGKYKGKWMPVVVIVFNAVGFLLFGFIFTGYGGATGLAVIFFLIGLLMIGLLIAGLLPKTQPIRD